MRGLARAGAVALLLTGCGVVDITSVGPDTGARDAGVGADTARPDPTAPLDAAADGETAGGGPDGGTVPPRAEAAYADGACFDDMDNDSAGGGADCLDGDCVQ